MKTLAEVIKAVEVCNDNHIECDKCIYSEMHYIRGERLHCVESGLFPDALFYLKEYRWVQENCADALAEKYPSENVPLTWDELKQMEGKPVWLEVDGYLGLWTIVHWNSNIVFMEYYDWLASPKDFRKAPVMSLDDTNFGTTWQAYRKERR